MSAIDIGARAVRGVFYVGLSSLSTVFLGFLGGIVLARLLGPDAFGTVGAATALFVFLDVRTRLMIDQRYMQIDETSPATLGALVSVNLALSLASLLLALLAAGLAVAIFQRADIALGLAVIGGSSILDGMSIAIRTHVEKQLAFRAAALVQSAGQISQFVVSIGLAFAGAGFVSLLVGSIAGACVTLIGLVLIVRPRFRLGNSHTARDLFRYGIRHGWHYGVAGVVLTYADNVIITATAGTTALGYYDRAYRTATLPATLVSTVLQRITLPTYRRFASDPVRLAQACEMSLWSVGTFAVPAAVALFVAAPDYILLLYGEPWLPATWLLRVLLLYSVARPLFDDLISLLVATDRSRLMGRIVAGLAFGLVAIGLPAAVQFGPVGVAIVVGATFSAASLILYGIARSIGISLRSAAVVPMIAAVGSLLAYALLATATDMNQIPLLWRFFVKVGWTLFFAFGIVLLFDYHRFLARVRLLGRVFRESPA